MTNAEDDNLERMLQDGDDGCRKLAHLLKLMNEFKSVGNRRSDRALLLAKEVYTTYNSLPAEMRQTLDGKFQRVEAATHPN